MLITYPVYTLFKRVVAKGLWRRASDIIFGDIKCSKIGDPQPNWSVSSLLYFTLVRLVDRRWKANPTIAKIVNNFTIFIF